MKRVFALVLTLATALGLAACNSGGGESGENVVRIGIFEPATGDNGAGGQRCWACSMPIRRPHCGYRRHHLYRGAGLCGQRLRPAKAPTAAAELVSKDVSVVLGSYGSTVSLAGGPVFGEAGVPAIGVGCTQSPDYGRNGITSDLLPGSVQGTVLANFARGEILCEKSLLPG